MRRVPRRPEIQEVSCRHYRAPTKRIREKVLDEVLFFMMYGTDGYYLPLKVSKPEDLHIILLNFAEEASEQEAMTIIAHEIAHYILKHDIGKPSQKKEAGDLCAEWGFARAYSEDIGAL